MSFGIISDNSSFMFSNSWFRSFYWIHISFSPIFRSLSFIFSKFSFSNHIIADTLCSSRVNTLLQKCKVRLYTIGLCGPAFSTPGLSFYSSYLKVGFSRGFKHWERAKPSLVEAIVECFWCEQPQPTQMNFFSQTKTKRLIGVTDVPNLLCI